jgi:alpha-L-fucosidase 2
MFHGRSATFALPFLMSLSVSAASAHSGGSRAYTADHLNDVEYGRAGDAVLKLDAFLPRTRDLAPAVIIVHGGGWVMGDRRTSVEPLFAPLEAANIAWFSISYRLATKITQFGLAIDDVQTAVEFVRAHAVEYGIDPKRIALLGESAGGQLAAMGALRLPPDQQVRAVVAMYAPTDLIALAKNSNYIPRAWRDSIQNTPFEGLVLAGLALMSPLDQVRVGMPPFLLIHGTDDALVPYSQSVAMCQRMLASGDHCELFPVTGGGHGIRWWEAYPHLARPYKQKLVEWLQAQLAPHKIVSS